MNRNLRLTGYAGLAGSLLMYAGDMLLYFTTQPIPDVDKDLLPSMGAVPLERLFIGGLMGPLAAVLYIIGFYHLFLSYARLLGGLAFSLMGIGWLLFCVPVLQKQTSFPRWVVIATPLVTIWFNLLWQMLPQPFLVPIAGGWNNLVCALIFAVSLLTLNKRVERQ